MSIFETLENDKNDCRDRMMDYCVELLDLRIVKPGEHWCSNMTYDEAIADTETYIKGTGWAGRVGFEYFNKGKWVIRHIDDVSDHAQLINKFMPHAKWDEASVFVGIDTSRSDSKRETFNMSFDEYMRHRNIVVHGSGNINTYPPHQFQIEYANFRNSRIIAGETAAGNESVTRWGKTFGVYNADYELINSLDFPHTHMKTLIYTGKPKVKGGWFRDIDHINYDSWMIHDSQSERDVQFSNNEINEYVFASAQGNHKGKNQKYDSRIKQVVLQFQNSEFRKNHFCRVILEECHAYLLTEDERKFIDSLNPDFIEFVSGTMGEVLESGIVDKDNVYRFSLVDAMVAKKNNHDRFKDFPTPLFIVNNHSQVFVSEDPENPNFAKALGWTGNQPIYPTDVDAIFTSIMSDTGSRKNMPLLATARSCPNINSNLFNFTTNHGWIVVPSGKADDETSVAAQSTIDHYLTTTAQTCWHKYKPLPVSAGGFSEREVNREQSQNEYTQTISAGSLNTGTSFPKLDHQIWLKESASYTEFWQTVGRLFEIVEGKDIVPVVIPTWNMYITMFKELALYTQKPGQPLDEVTKIMLDMLPGIDWTGEPRIIDWSLMVKQQLANNLKGASWKNPAITNYVNIGTLSKEERSGIPDLKDPSKAGQRVTDANGTNDEHKGGSNVQIKKRGDRKTSTTDRSTAERIHNFMKHVPAVIANAYMAGHECKNHTELLSIPDAYFNSYICNGAKDHYDWFVARGLLDTNEVDKRVEYDRQVLESAFNLK